MRSTLSLRAAVAAAAAASFSWRGLLADLVGLLSIRIETKLWDFKRPASFRKQARTGFESMFRSCELYTTIDSPAIPPTPHVRGHERTGHERHTIEGFSLGGLKDTDMRPGCRFKAIC